MTRFLLLILFVLLIPGLALSETRLGAILPLTGGTSVWGEGIKRGLELANEAHPGVFKIIYEDEKFCDSKQAVTAAKKLIELDSVKFLITACLNGTKALAPIAERAGIPVFSAGLLDRDSVSRFDQVVSLSAQIGSEAIRIANYLHTSGFRKVALFRHDDTFTAEFISELSKALERLGSPTLIDVAVIDSSFPWSTEIAKARQTKLDAFVIYLGNDELLNFMHAREQLKDSTPVVSGYIIESNFDAKQFGSSLTGIRYTYPAIASENDPARIAFDTKFSQMFGPSERPSVNAYFVFDAMHVLTEAIDACKSADYSCIWPYLKNSGKSFVGVSGKFQFLDDGSIERTFLLKEVQGEKFVPLPN